MQGAVTAPFAPAVVLLGAGRSRRMGRPKLLLPWGETTVVGHMLRQWRELAVPQIAVVIPNDAGDLNAELDRLGCLAQNRIVNPEPERGMFSSIQCAVAWPGWKAELTHWIIALGDQPQLRHATLRRLLEYCAAHPENICQPLLRGWPHHPVALPRRFFLQLCQAEAADLRAFLEQHTPDRAGFESDDEGLELDLDTPADYAAALHHSMMAVGQTGKRPHSAP